MMQTAQIGEPTAQQPSLMWDTSPPAFAQHSGLLGNRRAQGPALTTTEFAEEEVWLLDFLRRRFVNAQSHIKVGDIEAA